MTNRLILLVFTIPTFFNLTFGQNRELQIDSLFAKYSNLEKPGAVVAVVKEGKTVFEKGYGSANTEYNIPLSEKTPFHIASLTKQFTAFGILLLEEKEKLSLDDPVAKFVPELNEIGKGMTIRHLMSHTSGLRDQWHLLALAGWELEDVVAHSDVLNMIHDQRNLNFGPGERYMYSNSGYTLLAEIIESVSGKSYSQYMQEAILKPLGMSNTIIPTNHAAVVKNRAYSYYKSNGEYFKSTYQSNLYGATGIITTMEDMTKWMVNFQNAKIGDNSTMQSFDKEQKLKDGTTFGGALGQFTGNYKGRKIYQHTGSDAGFRTFLVRFPEENLSIAVFSNRSNSNTKELALKVSDLFLKPLDESIYTKQLNPIRPETITLSNTILKSYEGKYWDDVSNTSRTISLENDTLQYVRSNNNKSPIVPVDKNKFLMKNVDQLLMVSFSTEKNRDVMKININEGKAIVYEQYEDASYGKEALVEFQGLYYSKELRSFLKIILKNGKLLATNTKRGSIELNPVKIDFFRTDTWYLKFVEFVRRKQKVVGLKVSSNRMKNVEFWKISGDFSNISE